MLRLGRQAADLEFARREIQELRLALAASDHELAASADRCVSQYLHFCTSKSKQALAACDHELAASADRSVSLDVC